MQFIYKIENITTKKFYVGRTHDIKERWGSHRRMLSSNNHHSINLQRAFNKGDDLEFKVIKVINTGDEAYDLKEAKFIEQMYLDNYILGKDLYNMSSSSLTGALRGKNHPAYGKKWTEWIKSEETQNKIRQTMSKRMTGKNNPFYGKQHSDEVLDNLRNDARCKHLQEDNPFYGKKHSEAVKLNNSIKQKARMAKMDLTNNGKPKPITINGNHYRSISYAAKSLGISTNTLYRRIKNNVYEISYD